MSKYKTDEAVEFDFQGRFLSFASEPGDYKLKYIRLATGEGECFIKMPKELRLSLYRSLTPGDWVQVSGYRKFDDKKGTVKLKAYQISPATPANAGTSEQSSRSTSFEPAAATAPQKSKSTILVCQKSDCCKRGGRTLTTALQMALSDRGLADQVTIKGTGCMKRCKEGPNLVMPDKTRYCQIRPDTIPTLIEKHFPAS